MIHDCKAIACFTFNFYLYSVDATWQTTFKSLKELAHLFVVYPYYETHVDCFYFSIYRPCKRHDDVSNDGPTNETTMHDVSYGLELSTRK